MDARIDVGIMNIPEVAVSTMIVISCVSAARLHLLPSSGGHRQRRIREID